MMRKSVSALVRRPDFSRDAFHAYYESHHAPLGIAHFPFARYVRNHLLDAPDIGFDTLSEFWAKDFDAMMAINEGPVGAIFREDELRFMDKPRNAPAWAEETVLSASAQSETRSLHLLRWTGVGDLPRAGLLAHLQALAGECSGLSVDFIAAWGANGFPADALVWADGDARLPPPPGAFDIVRAAVRRCETPPGSLLGA